jgi:hypothetical protein
VIVLAAIGLSWLGLAVHNAADLGAGSLLGPETIGPTVVYLLLALGLLTPARRVAGWSLIGWGWLSLIAGGILSVLPLPFWPFRPEQTLRHYSFHVVYAVTQVPLLITLPSYLRLRRG